MINTAIITSIKHFIFDRKQTIGQSFKDFYSNDLDVFSNNIINHLTMRFDEVPYFDIRVSIIPMNKVIYDISINWIFLNQEVIQYSNFNMKYNFNRKTKAVSFILLDEYEQPIPKSEYEQIMEDLNSIPDAENDAESDAENIPIFSDMLDQSKWDKLGLVDKVKDNYTDHLQLLFNNNSSSIDTNPISKNVTDVVNYIVAHLNYKLSSYGTVHIESEVGNELFYCYKPQDSIIFYSIPSLTHESILTVIKRFISASHTVITFYLNYDHSSIGTNDNNQKYIWKKVEIINYYVTENKWEHLTPVQVKRVLTTDFDTGINISSLPKTVYCGKHYEEILFE